jgi:hypothetical protein
LVSTAQPPLSPPSRFGTRVFPDPELNLLGALKISEAESSRTETASESKYDYKEDI